MELLKMREQQDHHMLLPAQSSAFFGCRHCLGIDCPPLAPELLQTNTKAHGYKPVILTVCL